ncbi:NAD(P)/FAD-dependent oxidoreductase [Hellea balneolensis]|uniref:NAD(P)/FAD-dependent oxidoreductase n=1 Tax=Hellea balneolensis TaxID=287478 RepID=UPI0004095D8A|nr:NAD(P)/FAD-dependent oxidoreductase [Hellea balneolensis]
MTTSDTYDLIVIGAGAMGLAAAYEAAKAGSTVALFEADNVPGGMAAHFDFDGLSLERYYHFICKTDYDSFELFKELDIFDKLKWRETKMGYYYQGALYEWGNPFALLGFPKLNLIEKIRYGLLAFWCTRRRSWDKVEPLTAPEWLKAWLGENGYNKLWNRLFYLKFYDYTDKISATWIGTRIRRIGLSRKSLLQEELGYLEGGTETLVSALVSKIKTLGGHVSLGAPATEIVTDGAYVSGVKIGSKFVKSKNVISTVPTPFISKLVPSLPTELKSNYDAIPNIGVACLIFKLKKSVTENFWLNTIDESLAVPGIIEFSRLRPLKDGHIVYVPYYMPTDNDRWTWTDDDLLDEAFGAITAANPSINKEDILATQVSRLKYAQPICYPNFLDMLPPIQTPFQGLQIADTCYYYPEDRGISESIGLGRRMAKNALLRND